MISDILFEILNISEKIKKSNDFKRLKYLKKEINNKYKKEILNFKTCQSLYIDYKNKNILTDNIISNFINSKKLLYNKIEVKKYFKLEEKIETKINNILEEIVNLLNIKGELNYDNKKSIHSLF